MFGLGECQRMCARRVCANGQDRALVSGRLYRPSTRAYPPAPPLRFLPPGQSRSEPVRAGRNSRFSGLVSAHSGDYRLHG